MGQKVQQTEALNGLNVTTLIIFASNCAFKMLRGCQLTCFANLYLNKYWQIMYSEKLLLTGAKRNDAN